MLSTKDKNMCNEINITLEQVDCYIRALAFQHIPQQVTSPETRDLDVAELAQKSRIKLWQALEKGPIINVKAYLRSIVYHEAINMVRTYKNTLPLPVHEEDDLYGQQAYFAVEEMQDPLYIIEQEEQLEERAQMLAGAIGNLPRRQRWAMMCKLKEHIGDILPLIKYMPTSKKDIQLMIRPKGKKDAQRYAALLSVSRKKLRSQLVRTVYRT
jgi:DNA-directed RNA polymerase specialized sigma24 family protein